MTIAIPRSIDLLVAKLAVSMSGAAYCIVDQRWPSVWVRKVEEEIESVAVLKYDNGRLQIDLDDKFKKHRPGIKVQPHGDALDSPFLIYHTSGSTGKAKAVVMRHRGIIRGLLAPNYPTVLDPLVMACSAALPWDLFTLEVCFPLFHGGTCVLIEEPTPQVLVSSGLTTMWLTAARFNAMVEDDVDCFKHLQELLIGGERLSVAHVQTLLEAYPSVRLINGYGPAEAGFVTTHLIQVSDLSRGDGIPLGRPFAGIEIQSVSRALDGSVTLSADGEPAEIAIAGDALALGYAGSVNSSSFVQFDPENDVRSKPRRFYLTGDRGYWNAEDNLMFCGRKDRQLKIYGQRIDPYEVEQAILDTGLVSQCAVTRQARDSISSLLAAHVMFSDTAPCLDMEALRRQLALVLPSYKIPSIIVQLHNMPLSLTGKLDFKALHLPDRNELGPSLKAKPLNGVDPKTHPQDLDHETLAAILVDDAHHLMSMQHITIDDDLMLKGLDSLGAFRLVCRVSKKTTVQILASDVILERTARRIAAVSLQRHLSGANTRIPNGQASSSREHGPTEWETPWLQTQWLTATGLIESRRQDAALVGSACRFRGSLKPCQLRKAVENIVRRHEVLHTAILFSKSLGEFRSTLIPHAQALSIDEIDEHKKILTSEDVQRYIASSARQTNLQRGPILVVTLITESDGILMLVGAQHLVLDGHSETIFMNEINLHLTGQAPPPVATQYAKAVEQECNARLSEAWMKRLASIPAIDWSSLSTAESNKTYAWLPITRTSKQWKANLKNRAASESDFLFVLRSLGTAIRRVISKTSDSQSPKEDETASTSTRQSATSYDSSSCPWTMRHSRRIPFMAWQKHGNRRTETETCLCRRNSRPSAIQEVHRSCR